MALYARAFRTVARGLLLFIVPPILATGVLEAQPTGPAFRVNTYTGGRQVGQSIASTSNGAFTITWWSIPYPPPVIPSVVGQRFDSSGVPLAGEFRVDSGTDGFAGRSVIASDSAGNFVIAYVKGLYSTWDIFGQRFAASGAALGAEFSINTYTTGVQDSAAIAESPGGDFVVAWRDASGPGSAIRAQRFAAGGSALGAEFAVTEYPPASSGPKVATDASGNFVVAWSSGTSSDIGYGLDIHARRFSSAGAPLGPEFRVNTYTSNFQGRPSLASAADGVFVVVWSSEFQPAGSFQNIYGQRFNTTGDPEGPEFRVNSYGAWLDSSVAMNSLGNFVVVWDSCHQYLCPGAIVGGQRFARDGSPLGGNFIVDQPGVSAQPRVSMDLNGDFVVGWMGYDYDHSLGYQGVGVFARRYSGGVHGDVNADGVVNVTDILYSINHLFAGGPAPVGAADANSDGALDVGDILYLINYLFAGGPPPGA